MRKSVVIISLGVVALACVSFIAAPAYIQHRAIEEAAARGIALTIDHTQLTLDGVHLEGVGATTVQAPNAKIRVDEIDASWDAKSVVVIGAEVTIDGPVTPPNSSTAENPVPASAAGPSSVHVQSAHISWTHVVGDAAIDLADVSGELALTPHVGDSFTWMTNASLTWNGRKLGPFTTQLSRDTNGDHVRVAIDPADPAGDTFAVDHAAGRGLTRYEWVVNKRPLSKIGVPLDLLGFKVAGDPDIQLHVIDSVTRPQNGPAQGSGLVALSTGAIQLPSLQDPVTTSINLSWTGNPDGAMPLSDGRFAVGPFSGPITGTVTRPEGAIAVNLTVASNSVPCAQFATKDPVTSLLPGSPFGAMAAMTGMKSTVVGDIKIAGSVQFDSRNPAVRQLSVAPTNTCSLSISLGSGSK